MGNQVIKTRLLKLHGSWHYIWWEKDLIKMPGIYKEYAAQSTHGGRGQEESD